MDKYLKDTIVRMIGGKYGYDELFQQGKNKLLQDVEKYHDQLMTINMGSCTLDQKWTIIEEIEDSVKDILPNIDVLNDDDIYNITYDYYLTLNNYFRKHHGFSQ